MSEARNPDFGLWIRGPWTKTGTGHAKDRRRDPHPGPLPEYRARGDSVGRDTLFYREKFEECWRRKEVGRWVGTLCFTREMTPPR
jgi:hypothetical protein